MLEARIIRSSGGGVRALSKWEEIKGKTGDPDGRCAATGKRTEQLVQSQAPGSEMERAGV